MSAPSVTSTSPSSSLRSPRRALRDNSSRSRPLSSITAVASEARKVNRDTILLIVAALECLVVIVLKSVLITKLDYTTQQFVFRLCFGIVFIQAFQLYYVVDTVRTKNMFQLFGLVALSAFDMTITIGELTRVLRQFPNRAQPIYYIGSGMFSVQVVAFIAFVALAYSLYHGYGWEVYKRIGADLRMRSMYRWYQACVMIVKILVYVLVPFIVDDVLDDLEEGESVDILVMHGAALGGVLVAAFLSLVAVRNENRLVNAFALSLMMALLAYLACMVYLASTRRRGTLVDADKVAQSAIAMALTMGSITCMIKCQLNYDLGLLPLHQEGLGHVNSIKQISRSALLDDDTSSPVLPTQTGSQSMGHWTKALEQELGLVGERSGNLK